MGRVFQLLQAGAPIMHCTTIPQGRLRLRMSPQHRPLLIRSLLFTFVALTALGDIRMHAQETCVTNTIGQNLRLVNASAFFMGSPTTEKYRDSDERRHLARVQKAFYISETEVTQEQYVHVMGSNPSRNKASLRDAGLNEAQQHMNPSNLPVDSVYWDEAMAFCRLLSESPSELQAGRTYRLPTESEWELACRAGNSEAYCFGTEPSRLNEFVWHAGNSDGRTHPVKQLRPNALGLYDMHGNVWEWCLDPYRKYEDKSQLEVNPKNSPIACVLRGGSAVTPAHRCRSACRAIGPVDRKANPTRFPDVGFRVVMEMREIATPIFSGHKKTTLR